MKETPSCLYLTIIKYLYTYTLYDIYVVDDLLNIDNTYIEQMTSQIYPTILQLNKANSFNTESTFSDLDFSITACIV